MGRMLTLRQKGMTSVFLVIIQVRECLFICLANANILTALLFALTQQRCLDETHK